MSSQMNASMSHRVAVVTGAAGGIGRAISQALMARGATVHGLDLNADALETMAATAEDSGGQFIGHALDLGDRHAVDTVLDALHASIGSTGCDILVNNAGISRVKDFEATTDTDLDDLFAVNFHAAFRITRSLVPLMAGRPGAAMVNIASELALAGQWGYSAYSATKGAVLAWSRALAIELAPQGIRVNTVCPGPIDTPMLSAEFELADKPEVARAGEVATVPIGRLGQPGDIAEVVAFLASDAAAFVTGATWTVDGGKTAK